ncbi:hypothetical protein PABG_02581 [Paracoccidioides brasiliensis Pb03]|nr:hypothetical protein PABG_02581 [Paracoccidioides brasiliensis Pb03]
MPPDRSCFTPLNLPSNISLPACMDHFSLGAAPNTNLWRKLPDCDTLTAPILFTSLCEPFTIAEVTVTADWEMECDQGGLVIFAGPAPSHQAPPRPTINRNNNNSNSNPDTNTPGEHQSPSSYPYPPPPRPPAPCKWVKAGLEFSAGTVNASSVSAAGDGADWCLCPLALPNQPTSIDSLRIKLERIDHSLWVWYQLPSTGYSLTPSALSNTWRKLREVTSFFWGVEAKNVHVGVYASRPANSSISSTVWESRNGHPFVQGQAPGAGAGAGEHENSMGNRATDDASGSVRAGGLVVEFDDLEIL